MTDTENTITNGSPVEVLSIGDVIANWLEYGMDLPVTEVFAKSLVPACIEAIKAVNDHDLHKQIQLPDGVTITWMDTGETVSLCPAYAIVYRFQLTQWLNEEWF